ncbi:hypothetical protein HOY82DRAFT_599553 [Tuber indicum]|nr:hypothetical protein HOY82DRAFT_599553 [Tuber indicum]
MAALPLEAPDGNGALKRMFSSISSFFWPKPKPSAFDIEMKKIRKPTKHVTNAPESRRPKRRPNGKAPVLSGPRISKPKKVDDVRKATARLPPELRPLKAESTWGTAIFPKPDVHDELTANPWNDYRKRSLQNQESPVIPMTTRDMGASMELEVGKCRLTMSQEISLLIFTWFVAMVICGAIVWVIDKIQRKIVRFVNRGVTGFGEKKGWHRALHLAEYGSAITVIVAILLMVMAVIFSLKGILSNAI